MNTLDLLRKKRDGQALSRAEIEAFVQGIADKSIPDYQVSAWLMTCYIRGLDLDETTHLTRAMAFSGDTLDLSPIDGLKVDKHSTGGVGDKVTLVLAPLVASTGLIVAKLSGRGLGHTGGTIDKLEAIPGFQTSLSTAAFMQQLRDIQVAVAGQTQNLAPADKTLYALRDVTATVDSIPLIVASVLSKKIASGADVIVLDIKYGSGAFMATREAAQELARQMVEVGKRLDRSVSVLLSNMEQPLGIAVGHTLEVEEAIQTLKGQGPEDLTEVVLALGAMQLVCAQRVESLEEGKTLLRHQIASGKALLKLRELITHQGGDAGVIEDFSRMPHVDGQREIRAERDGWVHELVALKVGEAVRTLGGGRLTKDDVLDLGVGVMLWKKAGDPVKAGELLATLAYADTERADAAEALMRDAYMLGDSAPAAASELIGDMIWA
ncbi:MAG: thymidine phosphorylase [Candidatus Sericytochromatia bacterium]